MDEWTYAGYPNSGAYANAIVNGEVSDQQIAMNEYFSSPEGQLAGIANKLQEQYRDYDNAWSAEQAKIQREWSSQEAEKNRMFSMAEAEKSRNWQEYMSSSAHQRETRDLLAAGLNPVLSVMGGNGAAVTSGATASSPGNPSGFSANGNQSTGMALANIFATMMSNQTRLQEMYLSADLQRTLLDRQLAFNWDYGLTSLGVDQKIAQTYAGATLGAAALALEGTKYSSDNALAGTHYNADKNFQGTKYNSDAHLTGVKYSSDTSHQMQGEMIDYNTRKAVWDALVQEYMYQNYPQTNAGIVGAVGAGLREWADILGLYGNGSKSGSGSSKPTGKPVFKRGESLNRTGLHKAPATGSGGRG